MSLAAYEMVHHAESRAGIRSYPCEIATQYGISYALLSALLQQRGVPE